MFQLWRLHKVQPLLLLVTVVQGSNHYQFIVEVHCLGISLMGMTVIHRECHIIQGLELLMVVRSDVQVRALAMTVNGTEIGRAQNLWARRKPKTGTC